MTPVQHKDDCRAMKTRRPWECDCMPVEPLAHEPENDRTIAIHMAALMTPSHFRDSYTEGYAAGLKAPNYPAAAAVTITLALILVALC